MQKRIFDIVLVLLVILPAAGLMLLTAILVKLTSKGPALHWSKRAGVMQKPFIMPKFRTMFIGTPEVATDRLENPQQYLTPIGSFLRKTSLDELPQLISILLGHMSFVGPRPALLSQSELLQRRHEIGIDKLLPGLTGLAQIKGRDHMSTDEKIMHEKQYLILHNLTMDLRIIAITLTKLFRSNEVVF